MIVRGARGWSLRLPGEPRGAVRPRRPRPRPRVRRSWARTGSTACWWRRRSPLGIEALPAGEAEPLLDGLPRGRRRAAGAVRRVGGGRPRRARSRDAGRAARPGVRRRLRGGRRARRPGRLRAPRPGARDARAPRRAAADPPGPVAGAPPPGAPSWWAALTHYVAAMQAAWYAFAVWGRPAHPRLRVCFAMLAGLAPLQRERLLARGGRVGATPACSSTSRPTASARSTRCCARSASTSSSSAPTARSSPPHDLPLGDAVRAALRERNPSRLLGARPRRWPYEPRPRPPRAARPGRPDRRRPRAVAGRSCATARRSATSSSCGATATSTSG